MIYIVRALGIKQVQTKFTRMAEARLYPKPALETVASLLMRVVGQTFESQGRRGGGSWRQLSTSWIAQKQRLGLDPRIGHATLALRHSMTERGDPNQILDVTDNMVNLGSSLPYAHTQQKHRPFVKLTAYDRRAARNIIRDYLIASFRNA